MSPILTAQNQERKPLNRRTLVAAIAATSILLAGLILMLVLPWVRTVRIPAGTRNWSVKAYWCLPDEAYPQGHHMLKLERHPFVDVHYLRVGNAVYVAHQYDGTPDAHGMVGICQVERDPSPPPRRNVVY